MAQLRGVTCHMG